jgi:peptide/nickel transport system permease protein
VQFARHAGDTVTGGLGRPIATGRPVAEDLARVFPATPEMATLGILIGVTPGVPMGVPAAARQGTWIDHVIPVVGLAGGAIPAFWPCPVGLVLLHAKLRRGGGPGRIDIFMDGMVPVRTGLLPVDSLIAGDLRAFRSAFSDVVRPATIPGVLQPRFHRPDDPQRHAGATRPGTCRDRPGEGCAGINRLSDLLDRILDPRAG